MLRNIYLWIKCHLDLNYLFTKCPFHHNGFFNSVKFHTQHDSNAPVWPQLRHFWTAQYDSTGCAIKLICPLVGWLFGHHQISVTALRIFMKLGNYLGINKWWRLAEPFFRKKVLLLIKKFKRAFLGTLCFLNFKLR